MIRSKEIEIHDPAAQDAEATNALPRGKEAVEHEPRVRTPEDVQ